MLDQSSIHIRANAPEENPNHWTPNWLTEINTCWYAARWRTMLKRFLPAVSRAPKMRKEMESQLLFKCSIYINLFIYLQYLYYSMYFSAFTLTKALRKAWLRLRSSCELGSAGASEQLVETTWATWATWLGRSTMCPDVSGCVRMSLCFHKQQQQMFRSVDLLISDDLLTCLTLAPTKRGQSRFLHIVCSHSAQRIITSAHEKEPNFVLVGFSVCSLGFPGYSWTNTWQHSYKSKRSYWTGWAMCIYVSRYVAFSPLTDWLTYWISVSMKFSWSPLCYLCAKPSLQSVTVTQAQGKNR